MQNWHKIISYCLPKAIYHFSIEISVYITLRFILFATLKLPRLYVYESFSKELNVRHTRHLAYIKININLQIVH